MLTGRVTDEASPAIRRMFRALNDPSRALDDFGNRVVRSIVTRMPRGQDAEKGQPPVVRSGKFRAGVTYERLGKRGIDVGTNDVRGRILHEGGIIRPRRAKALAIPLNREARKRGPREWPQGALFLIRSDDKPDTVGVLFRKKGRDGVEPMYVLRGKVTIQPHPWLEVTDEDWAYFAGRLSQELGR